MQAAVGSIAAFALFYLANGGVGRYHLPMGEDMGQSGFAKDSGHSSRSRIVEPVEIKLDSLQKPAISPGPARGRSSRIWRDVTDALRQAIASGNWPVGSKLPRESDLADHFGVNRHTLRRAMGELARDGYIDQIQGRGSFLALGAKMRIELSAQDPLQGRAEWDFEPRFMDSQIREAGQRLGSFLNIDGFRAVHELRFRLYFQGVKIGLAQVWLEHERFARFDDALRREGRLDAALTAFGVGKRSAGGFVIGGATAGKQDAGLLEMRHTLALLSLRYTSSAQQTGLNDRQPVYHARCDFRADRVELVPEPSQSV